MKSKPVQLTPEAEHVGRRIAIEFTKGHYAACHNILDYAEEEAKKPPPDAFNSPIAAIEELDLAQRWINALDSEGYVFIHELTEEVLNRVRYMRNMGPAAGLAVRAAIAEYTKKKETEKEQGQ